MPQSHMWFVTLPCPRSQKDALKLLSTQQRGDGCMAPAPAAGFQERGTTEAEDMALQDLI